MHSMQFGYSFKLSELLLCVDAEEKLTVPKCFLPFLAADPCPDRADIRIAVRFSDKGEAEGTPLRKKMLSGDACIALYASGANMYTLLVPEAFRQGFSQNGNWLNYIPMERLLLPHGRVLLHASLVELGGMAYCFIAPSGGGKSTHAGLWQQRFGARLLNGDKALISAAGTPMAWGSPVAGSSGIHVNDGAPLRAVYVLTKAAEDSAAELSPRSALMALYSAAVKDEKDADFNGRLLDELVKLQKSIPVFSLRCTPKESAAETALHFIEERKSL